MDLPHSSSPASEVASEGYHHSEPLTVPPPPPAQGPAFPVYFCKSVLFSEPLFPHLLNRGNNPSSDGSHHSSVRPLPALNKYAEAFVDAIAIEYPLWERLL